MLPLSIFLPSIFIVLLILDYLVNLQKKTSIQIVNEMGIRYNLGNSFDSYIKSKKINNPDDAITLLGNPIPTKKLIANIKKYGFKTIRFPVTWIYFIDEFGNIHPEWILRVKEVVKWIIEKDIYCILNVYTDTKEWITGIESKNKYINLWKQIAEEFKDFNEYLIFESMNEPTFLSLYNYNYDTLLNFTQSFVDTIRNSEKFNKERLLIISGMSSKIDLTCSQKFKMPTDPANKLAISINYYIPLEFATNEVYWYDENQWGTKDNYKELLLNFITLKDFYVSKGIPVVIGEVGVMTEASKEILSIREYLYSIFSLSIEYEGIMACLWDTSNKNYGDMNYYNRLTDEWYDDKIKNILIKISKGKFVKSSDYYIYSNLEMKKIADVEQYNDIIIKFGTKKPLKLIINMYYSGIYFFFKFII
jgi:endoglucanase